MSENAVELVVAGFEDEPGAGTALQLLEEAKKERGPGIYSAYVIHRDKQNVLHIRELVKLASKNGPAAGALVGGVIGLLFPPEILGTSLLGVIMGELAIRLKNSGFSGEGIKELGSSLTPGTSAIIAVVDHQTAGDLQLPLKAQTVHVVRHIVDFPAKIEPALSAASPNPAPQPGTAADALADSVSAPGVTIAEGAIKATQDTHDPQTIPPAKSGADPAGVPGIPIGKLPQSPKTGASDEIARTP